MAKIPQPYTCDECGSPKKPSNGWFLAWTENPMQESVKIIIVKWEDKLVADREESNLDTKHLCGIDCTLRWNAKELGKIYGNQVQT